MTRPTWDEYWLDLAAMTKRRSTCLRRRVGAFIVSADNRPIASGYNGAPSGLKHCAELGCLRQENGVPSGERMELCRAVHAESNAVLEAGRSRTIGAKIYISGGTPCTHCAGMLVNAGIARVACDSAYPDVLASELLKEAGIEVVIL